MDLQTRIAKFERILANHLELARTSKDNIVFRNHVRAATDLKSKIRRMRQVSDR